MVLDMLERMTMTVEAIHGVRGTVAGWDPAAVDRATAGGVARALVDLASEVARRQVLALVQARAVGLLADSRACDVAGWLRAQGVPGRTARVLGDAAWCAEASAPVRDALESGVVAVDQVAALRPIVELVVDHRCAARELVDLLDQARHDRVEDLRLAVRAVELRVTQDDPPADRPVGKVFESTVEHGQGQLRAVLNPEDHTVVRNAIDRIVDEQWRAGHPAGTSPSTAELPERRARALVELAQRSLRGDRPAARASTAEVIVIVDAITFLSGVLRPDSRCRLADGSPVPVTTAHRLAAEAGLRCYATLPDGRVGLSETIRIAPLALDHGRRHRLATPEQRLALAVEHTGCPVRGCTVRIERTKAHHLQFWEHGGGTDLVNLIPICQQHHHLVHDRDWSLRPRPDGTYDLEPPPPGSPPPRSSRRRASAARAAGRATRHRADGSTAPRGAP